MDRIWLNHYPASVPHEIDISRYPNILAIFTEAVKKFPNRKAFTHMGVSLTYNELDEISTSFAAFLQNDLNLKKGDRLGIQMPNVLQYPIALFGALKAGVVIVNTNPLYTDREMKHQYNDSGCKAVVILANFAGNLERILKETKIESVVITELGDLFGFPKSLLVNSVVKYVKKMVPPFHLPDAIPFKEAIARGRRQKLNPVSTSLDDLAFLQYTGGTTGVSKGAMLTQRNVAANMEQIYRWIKPVLKEGAEVAVAPLPMYHIFCLTVHAFALVQFGVENVLVTNPRDLPDLLKLLKKTKPTIMSGVNTLFNGLMNHANFDPSDLSSLKISVAGGMALQKAVADKWMKTTKTLIVEGYGLTETSPVVCVNPVDGSGKVGYIGLPVPSTDVKLIDDDGNEVKQGEPGELCARGPQVMKGYWQRPDETAKVMTADGWLKTGDVAVMDEQGYFKIVDRKKDMILVSGFNVYPNEVEDVIATHPGVLEVAAIGVADQHSGEVVKAFIVKKDQSLTEQAVIEHARKSLVGYKVPKQVEFRTELPKTNVGKILRRALKEGT